MILEAVGQAPYESLLRERISKPIDLAALLYGMPVGGNVSRGYAKQRQWPESNIPASLLDGAAGLATVPTTLVRWDQAFFRGAVVNEASLAFLTTSAVTQGVATKYAAGWFDDRAFGHRRLSHGGSVPGFTVRNTVFRDDDFQIVVAMNSTDSDARSIDNRAAALLLGGITDAQIQAVAMQPAPGKIPAETQRARELYTSAVSGKLPSSASCMYLSRLHAPGAVKSIVFWRSYHFMRPQYAIFAYRLSSASGQFRYSIEFDDTGKFRSLCVESWRP